MVVCVFPFPYLMDAPLVIIPMSVWRNVLTSPILFSYLRRCVACVYACLRHWGSQRASVMYGSGSEAREDPNQGRDGPTERSCVLSKIRCIVFLCYVIGSGNFTPCLILRGFIYLTSFSREIEKLNNEGLMWHRLIRIYCNKHKKLKNWICHILIIWALQRSK